MKPPFYASLVWERFFLNSCCQRRAGDMSQGPGCTLRTCITPRRHAVRECITSVTRFHKKPRRMLDVRLRYTVKRRPFGAKMKAVDFEPSMQGGFLRRSHQSCERSLCFHHNVHAVMQHTSGGLVDWVIIHRPYDG